MLDVEKSCEFLTVRGMVRLFGNGGGVLVGGVEGEIW